MVFHEVLESHSTSIKENYFKEKETYSSNLRTIFTLTLSDLIEPDILISKQQIKVQLKQTNKQTNTPEECVYCFNRQPCIKPLTFLVR